MQGGNAQNSSGGNRKPESTPTSSGSKPRSPAIEHPVRDFVAHTLMGWSIYFAWLALIIAPWRADPPKENDE